LLNQQRELCSKINEKREKSEIRIKELPHSQ